MASDAKKPNLRLTKTDREGVVRRAVEASFQKQTKVIAKEESAIGIAAYELLFPVEVRKLASKMPKDWLRMDSCLRLVIGVKNIRMNVSPAMPVPSSAGYGCQILGRIQDRTLIDRFETWLGQKEDLETKRHKVTADLTALLDRASTLNSLREMWPEGEPFYRHLTPRISAPVPAVQVQDINAALGLKKAA